MVSALRKWAGWIGFQPLLILTDHRALEAWVNEFVDTPSGPAGRRARWHETLSKFDLQVKYVPGKTHIVADAMSRYAYPASKAFQDCSWHGSLDDALAMKKIIQEEFEEEHMVALLLAPSSPSNSSKKRQFLIMGPRGHLDSSGELPLLAPEFIYREEAPVLVTTRGNLGAQWGPVVDTGVPGRGPSPPASPDSEESQGSGEQPGVAEWDMGFRFKGAENVPYPLSSRVEEPIISQDVSDSQESIESRPDGLGQGEEERPIGNDVSSPPRSPVHIHHNIPPL